MLTTLILQGRLGCMEKGKALRLKSKMAKKWIVNVDKTNMKTAIEEIEFFEKYP